MFRAKGMYLSRNKLVLVRTLSLCDIETSMFRETAVYSSRNTVRTLSYDNHQNTFRDEGVKMKIYHIRTMMLMMHLTDVDGYWEDI